ncbi:hypothetical protein P4H94_24645 [Paenibacillus macerans]|uniref:Uncharacterized protein n=1 Tax=Paenibacillus macerans TaxID=44252 RepID=A0A6N8EUS9_PAEMA|nr:hypothetical protein [Paenibacillus macerans]MBS5913219.1 hypothetical protein [Paenibacillus macerans]MEC0140042.1 hypothetical protein [Paenibacillus macerans]MEC0328651.1 hypothetical protein [Paenibacillus macerans]MUG22533.1 hypothetical protein [Paenibacillus macerans]UMV46879.1 hypothetical protein LMZ02_25960 [Paenibacillus macerans]
MDIQFSELLRSVIKEELEPINRQLVELTSEQQQMRQEQELMKQDQELMKQDQELIKRAVLETNDRLKNVETILENQHKIIELLSARSIQQEAELKRIK